MSTKRRYISSSSSEEFDTTSSEESDTSSSKEIETNDSFTKKINEQNAKITKNTKTIEKQGKLLDRILASNDSLHRKVDDIRGKLDISYNAKCVCTGSKKR